MVITTNSIVVRIVPLPVGINGFTAIDYDGIYNIYINDRISYCMQLDAYKHEVQHILHGDFENSKNIIKIETAI